MSNNDRHFAQRIRAQYTEKEYTELDELRELDRMVKRPTDVLAYTLGGIGAVIMGAGMSLVMTDVGKSIGIADGLIPGILIGVLGLITVIVNYPLHRAILARRKKKYGAEIIELSDRLINK